MYYRIGFPGWKVAGRFGARLLLRVDVSRDDEAKVFIATSPDLKGLVAEGATTGDLFKGVYDCADMLLEQELHKPLALKPAAAFTGEFLAT